MSLIQELKRRNVFRVAAAYAVTAWLVVQVAETVIPLFGFGDAPVRIIVILLAIGFVPAIIISWVFQITPDGLKRDTDIDRAQSIPPHSGKMLDRVTIAALTLAVSYFAFDKFVLDPQRDINITESAVRAGAEQAREEARLDMFSDKSIAVLPFTNRSEQKEDEYFTDGMHDELLTRLSQISDLKVISRTSVMRYRDTEKSIPDIAKELSVASVLEGGVQRSGDQVRINVQLIDANTDEHLWAEIYDRQLTAENLFAIQSEISAAIAKSLAATLSPEERARVYDLPTANLDAYNHYLRARQSMALRTREGVEEAQEEFESAVELDPEFALAWVGIGDSIHLLADMGAHDWEEHKELHRAAVEKALAIDSRLGEAYTSLGFVHAESGEPELEMAAFRKAIELNPNYAQAYHWFANSLPLAQRDEKRLPLLYKAAQLDPLSSVIQLNIAAELRRLGRLDEGRDVIERLLVMDPNFVPAYGFLATVDNANGQLASAAGHLNKALELDPGHGRYFEDLAMIYIALGDVDAVRRVLDQVESTLGRNSVLFGRLAYFDLIAQARYGEAIEDLEELPENTRQRPIISWAFAMAYTLSGDYESAREHALVGAPYIADRDRWQHEIIDNNLALCEFAGAIHETGDDIGWELLQLLIQNYEANLSESKQRRDAAQFLVACYLAAGSYQQALDIIDRESANGRLIQGWWFTGKLPWWVHVEDDPRYREVVERMERQISEQRALLN